MERKSRPEQGVQSRFRRGAASGGVSRYALTVAAFAVLLAILVIWLVLVLGTNPLATARAAVSARLDAPASAEARRVRVVVREGETAASIAEKLAARGLIRNAEVFRWVTRWRGVDGRFLPGEYELSPHMTSREIMRVLQAGDPTLGQVTYPEGWRAAQMADALAARGLIDREAFLAATRRADYPLPLAADLPAGVSLEGYLFPDTYQVGQRTSAQELVLSMVGTFERRVGPQWERRRGRTGLALHEAVTLASIVEREAQRPDERPLIAGVFLNRLRAGMPLQADPTVQFALVGPAPAGRPADGYWKSPLSARDLAVDSPYNTYRRRGLPPGPIANPGLAAIEAVLDPAPSDYLYFVATEDGRHRFARTYEEHLKNVAAQR